jgi:hypothetical protein
MGNTFTRIFLEHKTYGNLNHVLMTRMIRDLNALFDGRAYDHMNLDMIIRTVYDHMNLGIIIRNYWA